MLCSLEKDWAFDVNDLEVLTDMSLASELTYFSFGLLLDSFPCAELGLVNSCRLFPLAFFLCSRTSLWFVRKGEVGLSFF